MTTLPNPFEFHVGASDGCGTAAARDLTDPPVAAADRFVLDVGAFMNDIEPLPAFLCAPSQSYLKATDLIPVLEVLAGH